VFNSSGGGVPLWWYPWNFSWMSADGHRTKCRRIRNIAEHVNRLSMVHERYRQTDGRRHIANGNTDFVLSGKWDRKYKLDFRDVQILVSVSISALWSYYAHNSFPIFTKFCTRLLFVQQTGSSLRILDVADSDLGSFQALVTAFFNRSAPSPITQIKFRNADFVFNGELNRK